MFGNFASIKVSCKDWPEDEPPGIFSFRLLAIISTDQDLWPLEIYALETMNFSVALSCKTCVLMEGLLHFP